MAVTLNYKDSLQGTETLVDAEDTDAKSVINHVAYDYSDSFTGSTSVAVNVVNSRPYNLVAGVKTIDLTALVGVNGAAVDLTGKKIVAIRIVNTDPTHSLTVAKGATNGFTGFDGAAAFNVGLPVLGRIQMFHAGNCPVAVGSTHKTLDFSDNGVGGTGGFTITIYTN